jgi:DNA ligase (NAD+)
MNGDFFNCDQETFREYLINLSNEYYNSSSSKSDEYFDNLVDVYERRFNETWNYIGNTYRNSVTLPVYMGSLNKCKDDRQLSIFIKRVSSSDILVSDKIDGVSLLCVYKGEKLNLFTRGDGIKGNDVSFLQQYVTFPKIKSDITVRGELVMLKHVFHQKYKLLYENPRAMVCGLINSKDKDYEKIKDICFYAYYIYDYSKSSQKMFNDLIHYDFNTPHFELIHLEDITKNTLSEYIKKAKQTRVYEVDGVVLSDNVAHKEKSGENPKYTIAFKILGNTYITKVVDVEWNLSKHNILKPKIKLEPVSIDGSTITYTSGFNAKYIVDNNIGKDTIVEMTKSGDVIPYIVSVIKGTSPILPENFIWTASNIEIESCSKNSDELFIKRMVCLFEVCEIKGVKEGTIKNIVTAGFNTEYLFLNVIKKQLLCLENVKDKSSDNILNAICQLKRELTLGKLMCGSCMFPSFGAKKINNILENIPELHDLVLKGREMKINLAEKLTELGFKKTAGDFVKYLGEFREYLNRNNFFITYILHKSDEEVKVEKKSVIRASADYEKVLRDIEIYGNNFCMSGFRDERLKIYIEDNGGIMMDSVTKKLNFLIVKDKSKGSSKIEKAENLGITIIDLNNI